ncbi:MULTISPECIES: hypothetical protein [unclassified Nocardiopsis]|uniref:hypothetical protein n=1 Tax=Nocardiopsis TaxID=2013 RepID=UPI00387AE31B
MAAPLPFTARAPLPAVGEHTLVRAIGEGAFPSATELDHLVASVWRRVRDLEQIRPHRPLTVLEIASRAGLSRGVAILAVTELLLRRQVRVSRPRTGLRLPMAEVRDNLAATHFDPRLASAKVLVLGTPELAARQFVGSCSHAHPVAVQEQIPEPPSTQDAKGSEGAGEAAQVHSALGSGRRPPLSSLLISMGTLPVGDLHLCLLALPEPQMWDALWPSAVRDACGIILIAHPDHLDAAAHALPLLRDLHVPVHVVLDHPDGTAPDTSAAAELLQVDPEHMTMADVRSVPAARAALRDLINQDPVRPEHLPLRTPRAAHPNGTSTYAEPKEGR